MSFNSATAGFSIESFREVSLSDYSIEYQLERNVNLIDGVLYYLFVITIISDEVHGLELIL
jgi:hypothetical protein